MTFHPSLRHNEHRLMAFAHTGFITKNYTLLVRGTQGKAGRSDLERISLNIRGCEHRQQLIRIRQCVQLSRSVVYVKRRLLHGTPPLSNFSQYHRSKLSAFSRKSYTLMTRIPSSVYQGAGLSLTTMIFLKVSSMRSRELDSCCILASSGMANADWT